MKIDLIKKLNMAKSYRIKINNFEFKTPFFFPSISTYKNNFDTIFKWVLSNRCNQFLFSAYDLNNKRTELLAKKNMNICLDSGGFELKILENPKKWDIYDLINVCNSGKFDMIISLDPFFDKEVLHKFFHTKNDILILYYEKMVESINYESLFEFAITEHKPEMIIKQLKYTLKKINPNAIAIPEENLGFTFSEKISNIETISNLLSNQSNPILFHLRGCSNPLSMIEYSLSGVDIFDGLGWSSKVIKKTENISNEGKILHNWKTFDYSKLDNCECDACKSNKRKKYNDKVLAHNLFAYKKLLSEIQLLINDH